MSVNLCARFFFLPLVLLMAVGQVIGQGVGDIELVPHPDLAELKPEIREALQPAVDYFRDRRAKLEGSRLGVAYGRMGINYFAHQQQEAAGACFRNAAILDPENPRWPYLLAVHYEETGLLDDSVESYRAALLIDPTYLPGYVRLGRVLLDLLRLEEAEAAFEVVLMADEDNAAALAGLGRVAFERQQYEKAISYLQKAMSIEPEADVLHFRLGMAYRAVGETDKAKEQLSQAGERRPVVRDPLLTFVQSHIRGADHYLQLAAEAENEGDVELAIDLYEIATNVAPFDIDALLRLGQLQAHYGGNQQALSSFSRVLGIEPDNARANYFFGTLLEQQGDDIQAREHYQVSLKTEPRLVEPRLLLANSLMRSGEYMSAGDHYLLVAQSLPDNADVIYLLGMARLAAGQCQEAISAMLVAYRLSPTNPTVATALVRACSTCGDVADEQKQQALAVARSMYQERPGMETAETLAMAAAANGEFDDAVDYQAQAIFEALKMNLTSRLQWMQETMEHYVGEAPASEPWPSEADVYKPPRLPPTTATGERGNRS